MWSEDNTRKLREGQSINGCGHPNSVGGSNMAPANEDADMARMKPSVILTDGRGSGNDRKTNVSNGATKDMGQAMAWETHIPSAVPRATRRIRRLAMSTTG